MTRTLLPQHISGGLSKVREASLSSYGTPSDSCLEGSLKMYFSGMAISIKDRLDLARTSHIHLGVPVRLLSSLSKIPRKQKDVLKWTRIMRSLWELLRMVSICARIVEDINVSHPPSRLSRQGTPKSHSMTNSLLVLAPGSQKSSKYGSAPEQDLTPRRLFVAMPYSSWTTCECLLLRLCNYTHQHESERLSSIRNTIYYEIWRLEETPSMSSSIEIPKTVQ
jgi:hypothetical protein